MSHYETNTPKRRADLFQTTDGRCFYCGIHVRCGDEALPRDWLIPRGTHNLRMIPEHTIPLSRGGTDHADNMVPACFTCNSRKGSLTISEFSLWWRLRLWDLNAWFWGYEPGSPRDWICCYSEPSTLFKYNEPQAIVAFGRGKIARK